MEPVVYILTLVESGIFYIGSTQNLARRLTIHFSQLRANAHQNFNLQNAWNKSQDKEVLVNSIPTKDREEAFQLEEILLKQAFNGSRSHLLANLSETSKGSDAIKRHPYREDIIAKRTQTNRDFYENCSEQERRKRYSKFGDKNGMFGKTHTLETRKLLSEKLKGHSNNRGIRLSPEHVRQISERQKLRTGSLNSFYGKKHSTENLEKFRANKLGVTPTNARKVMADGVLFDSCAAVARYFKITQGLVTYRLKSEKYKDWFYVK